MYIDQLVADVAQLCGGGSAAVDPGPAFALGVHASSEQQFIALIETVVLQPGVHCRVDHKACADFGAACTFAHHTGVGACAQHQLQRVYQNGFTGAGFAAEHAEAVGYIEF